MNLSINPTERLIGLIALIMFFVGMALVRSEVARWRKTRMERYEGSPASRRLKKRVQHWHF